MTTKKRPLLKQFGQLTPADFAAVPVWASCHSFDADEPWSEDTDEETFRPWTGALPADPAQGMFLVQAAFRTANGRELAGFLTPATPDGGEDLGLIQPYLAIGDRFFGFWGGMQGVPAEQKRAFYTALGAKNPAEVFPIRFASSPKHALGIGAGAIAGFYRTPDRGGAVVEP